MASHTYYQSMLTTWVNRKLVIWSIISVAIPILYIIKSKIFSVKKFFLYVLPATLMVYTTAFTLVKDSIIGGSAGFIILMVNTLILYFLAMYFIVGIAAFGTRISTKWIQFKETRRQEMLINF